MVPKYLIIYRAPYHALTSLRYIFQGRRAASDFSMPPLSSYTILPVLATMALLSTNCGSRATAQQSSRVVTVAESGSADVVGNDNVALQKAVDLLRSGDTLSIGAG